MEERGKTRSNGTRDRIPYIPSTIARSELFTVLIANMSHRLSESVLALVPCHITAKMARLKFRESSTSGTQENEGGRYRAKKKEEKGGGEREEKNRRERRKEDVPLAIVDSIRLL